MCKQVCVWKQRLIKGDEYKTWNKIETEDGFNLFFRLLNLKQCYSEVKSDSELIGHM